MRHAGLMRFDVAAGRPRGIVRPLRHPVLQGKSESPVPRPIPILVAVLLAVLPARAEEEWQDHAQVRLIDGGLAADGVSRLAGLEILLDPGWKTYWRIPGDSGIPPRMDFSASANVADVAVEWPAPELHYDGYGWIVGYTDTVIFPLLVTPGAADEPVSLDVKLDYAVCKDICVPVEARAEIALDGTRPRVAEIDFYRARVPERIDAPGADGGVVSAKVTRDGASPVLDLAVRLPGRAEDAFAVVEGPDGWYLPVPEPTGARADGTLGFRVPLDGAGEPAGIAGKSVRVTGVSPGYSFEQAITLD